jgi:hypothetical protein
MCDAIIGAKILTTRVAGRMRLCTSKVLPILSEVFELMRQEAILYGAISQLNARACIVV